MHALSSLKSVVTVVESLERVRCCAGRLLEVTDLDLVILHYITLNYVGVFPAFCFVRGTRGRLMLKGVYA